MVATVLHISVKLYQVHQTSAALSVTPFNTPLVFFFAVPVMEDKPPDSPFLSWARFLSKGRRPGEEMEEQRPFLGIFNIRASKIPASCWPRLFWILWGAEKMMGSNYKEQV